MTQRSGRLLGLTAALSAGAVVAALAVTAGTGPGRRADVVPRAVPASTGLQPGRTVVQVSADHPTYDSLSSLADAADTVVEGTLGSSTVEPGTSPGLDADGAPLPALPHTLHRIAVTSVHKGTAVVGSDVVVSVLGGDTPDSTFQVGDGVVVTPGSTYLFFLRRLADGRYYPLAGNAVASRGPDGSFVLSTDTTGDAPLRLTGAQLAVLSSPSATPTATTGEPSPTPSATASRAPSPTPSRESQPVPGPVRPTPTPTLTSPPPTASTSPLLPGQSGQPSTTASSTTAPPSPSAGTTTPPTSTAPAGPPLPRPVLLLSSARTVAGGPGVRVTVMGTPGAQVRLLAYTRPSTVYRAVRTAVLPASGQTSWVVRPATNTRLYGEVGGVGSTSAVLHVASWVSLRAVRNAPRELTFTGRTFPVRPGQLVSVYRLAAGGRVLTSQARTDADGVWTVERSFAHSGEHLFLATTGGDLTNVAGSSRVRPTIVH
ncbi:MAG: hypothetical protein JWM64_2119 [Frankiales bacterium]|nr:hypothetical protein [Frankiales bacterium]